MYSFHYKIQPSFDYNEADLETIYNIYNKAGIHRVNGSIVFFSISSWIMYFSYHT